jgi:hypothetical protein
LKVSKPQDPGCQNFKKKFRYEHVLVIAQSPLQLMAVVQWITDYRPKSYDLVLIYDPRSVENLKQMMEVSTLFKLPQFEVIKNTGASSFFKYARFIKLAINRDYDCAVIGGYGSFHQALVANLNAAIFLIDDGADAFGVLEKMKAMGPNWGLRERGLKVLRFRVFGLKSHIEDPHRIYFYSFLLDHSESIPRVVNHRFESLKSVLVENSAKRKDNDRVFFIDTPLVESGLVSVNVIELAYEKAITMGSQKLVYIPHRSQHNSVSYHLASRLGLEIIVPEMPVELYFLINALAPSKIFGTATTSMFSLKLLFPDCLFYVFDIRPFLSVNADFKSYDGFYESAAKEGIFLVSIEA